MERGPKIWIDQARNYLEYQVRQGFVEFLPEPTMSVPSTRVNLETIRAEMGECTRCPLSETRTRIVFGEGNAHADLMFVGEGPGADEDKEGRPFVGRAGGLLTRMIKAMGLDRSQVYIANVVKCRPPGNRDPQQAEISCCLPFLEAQIESIEPRVIVALGRVATRTLLETSQPMGKMRGEFRPRRGTPVMPTYHPSFLLRKESDRRYKGEAWDDLKKVMALLDLPIPGEGSS